MRDDPIILGLTTSSSRGGAALCAGGCLLAQAGHDDEMAHAERLFTAIEEVFARAAVRRTSLAAVACDLGPGSFAGVRAGLAAAKGLALGLGIPLLGIGSLQAMAAAALAAADPRVRTAVAVLDAKRSEVFFASYGRDGEERAPAVHVAVADAAAALVPLLDDAATVLCGRAAMAAAVPPERISRAPGSELPDAAWIARLGALRMKVGGRVHLDAIEPRYLRAPDAVPNLPPPLFDAAPGREPPV